MFRRAADELTPAAMADPTSPKMVSHTGSFHAASEQTLLAPSEAPWRHDDVPLESTEQLQQPADFDVNEHDELLRRCACLRHLAEARTHRERNSLTPDCNVRLQYTVLRR